MTNTKQKKVAIITGGAGWIGQAIARHLAADGTRIVIADRDLDGAQSVAKQINDNGGNATVVELDVCDPVSCQAMVDSVLQSHGSIDILVNNAGGSARKDCSLFQDADVAVLNRIIDINLKGPLFCTRAVVGHMVERKQGIIINMSSLTGVQGLEYVADYSAAKGGVIAFTKALAKELGPQGINVNAVCPGLVPRPEEDPARALQANYLGRVCQADQVAALVHFLVSDAASFITGQNYIIDGGRSLAMKGS